MVAPSHGCPIPVGRVLRYGCHHHAIACSPRAIRVVPNPSWRRPLTRSLAWPNQVTAELEWTICSACMCRTRTNRRTFLPGAAAATATAPPPPPIDITAPRQPEIRCTRHPAAMPQHSLAERVELSRPLKRQRVKMSIVIWLIVGASSVGSPA